MHYSSCSVSTSVYMQHIVRLSINILPLTKMYQAIECLQSLLECNDSGDAHLILKIEATLLDENSHNESHNIHTPFELRMIGEFK